MGNYEKMQPIAQEIFNIKRLSGSYAEVATALGATRFVVDQPDDLGPMLEKDIAEVRGGKTVLIRIISPKRTPIIRYNTLSPASPSNARVDPLARPCEGRTTQEARRASNAIAIVR